jgi:hypothetical protein
VKSILILKDISERQARVVLVAFGITDKTCFSESYVLFKVSYVTGSVNDVCTAHQSICIVIPFRNCIFLLDFDVGYR